MRSSIGPTLAQLADSAPRLESYAALHRLETPCYLYDPLRVAEDYADLKRALGTGLIVSIKANPDPALLDHCASVFQDGIELASQGELALVRHLSITKYVNTPGLTPGCLRGAIDAAATLVLDNLYQVEQVIAAARSSAVAPLVLRLNPGEIVPDVNLKGLADRFGMSVDDLIEAASRLSAAGLPVGGMHVFAGSNLFARHGLTIAGRLGGVLLKLEQVLGYPVEFINLGGGFPTDWRSLKFDFESYRTALEPLQRGRTLVHEAGRAIFSGCGAFVTRVVSRKRLAGHHLAVCDGGIVHSFQLAQTELAIKLPRSPKLVYADRGQRARAAEPVLFVGNSCNNLDRIGRLDAGAALPEPGDYCVFEGVGAYFATYTLAGFLGIPPAQTYLSPGILPVVRD